MTEKNKKIKAESSHDIYDNYWEFSQFMGQFAVDADFDKFNEVATIMEYNEPCDRDYQRYLKVKSQTNDILQMEPFPYDAIQDSADRNLTKGANNEEEKTKMVKDWLLKILDLLEKRVTGKL